MSNEFKVIVVGNSSVGKTSIIMRFHRNIFCSEYQTTVGASFISKTIESQAGNIVLNIWDTAGQEKYRSLVPMFSRNACVAIVVFDINNAESFDGMKSWVGEVQKNVSDECKILIVGNKTDLECMVRMDEVNNWVNENQLDILYVSAKTGDGINELFQCTADLILEKFEVDKTEPIKQLMENESRACC